MALFEEQLNDLLERTKSIKSPINVAIHQNIHVIKLHCSLQDN